MQICSLYVRWFSSVMLIVNLYQIVLRLDGKIMGFRYYPKVHLVRDGCNEVASMTSLSLCHLVNAAITTDHISHPA